MTDEELGKSSFLVVDDDDFSRSVIVEILTILGCTNIWTADNGEAALQLSRQHKPAFVLLDIYMPNLDGWALLDRMRRSIPDAAVLMITGSIRPDDFKKSLEKQVDGFCIKPVLPSILKRALGQAREYRHSLHA